MAPDPLPTQEAVEKGARAANLEAGRQRGLAFEDDWDTLTEQERGGWRLVARAVLEAASPTRGEPCETADCSARATKLVRLTDGDVDGAWPYCDECADLLVRTDVGAVASAGDEAREWVLYICPRCARVHHDSYESCQLCPDPPRLRSVTVVEKQGT